VRAWDDLKQSNVNVCGVVVHRVLPEGLDGDFYTSRRKQEQIYLENLERISSLLKRESESAR
jgi:anion-transporting  ArsA/GET3 family ATPase